MSCINVFDVGCFRTSCLLDIPGFGHVGPATGSLCTHGGDLYIYLILLLVIRVCLPLRRFLAAFRLGVGTVPDLLPPLPGARGPPHAPQDRRLERCRRCGMEHLDDERLRGVRRPNFLRLLHGPPPLRPWCRTSTPPRPSSRERVCGLPPSVSWIVGASTLPTFQGDTGGVGGRLEGGQSCVRGELPPALPRTMPICKLSI